MSQQGNLVGLDPNRKLQVSGGQGLRARFERRGPRPASERPDPRRPGRSGVEQPDLELIAAGDEPIDLPGGPVRRIEPQRELLLLGAGGQAAIEGDMADVEAIVIEVFKAPEPLLRPVQSRGGPTSLRVRMLTGPRPATWMPVELADLPGQVFVGERIGVVFHRPAGDKVRLQWLHRSKRDILGGARPGATFRLTRPTVETRRGPWYIAGHDMGPHPDADGRP